MALNGHFIFLIDFLIIFVLMAVVGIVRLAKEGRVASSILVLLCAGIFCISTFLAATL